MSDDLARARAREAACRFMLNKWPNGESSFNRDDMIAAFVEGYRDHLCVDVLSGDELALTATVLDAASRGEPFTKSDAARAAKATLEARDRIERLIKGQAALTDQRAIEQATGQRQLDDATALMTEAAKQFRTYERHHMAKVSAIFPVAETSANADTIKKANANALIAMRLEAWLAGKDQYPTSFEREHPPGYFSRIELPRAMSAADQAEQEAFVSAALDAGVDQISEADEPYLGIAVGGFVDQGPRADIPVVLAHGCDVNAAEIARQIGEKMVDGKVIKGVDHESFDRAAAYLDQPVEVPPLVAAMTASIDEISSLPVAPAQSPCDMCPGEYPTPAAAASDGKSPRDMVADEPDPLAALVHARNWLISAESLIAEAAEFIRGVTGANPGSDSADLCQRLDAWLTPMATRPADEGAEKEARRSSATHQGDNHGYA